MVFTRRAVAKALPVAALGTGTLLAVAVGPAARAEERQIEVASARYRATKDAFAETLSALEQALPKLHPSLDMTKRRSGAFQYEGERCFNGERAERTVDSRADRPSG